MKNRLVLSAAQQRIIGHDNGHLRIVACPGSGKTETVSRRVAELIKNGAEASKIVAFTFTEKAAGELKFRIRRILEETCPEKSDFGDMYVGTIDSFCLYLLKKIRPEYKSFEVLDSSRRASFVDRWYYKIGMGNLQTEKVRKWGTIDKFCRSVDLAVTERIDMSLVSDENFVRCYREYEEMLREERFFDFVSIIATLLKVLEKDPDALEYVGENVRHVVFDEYQDVNRIQEDLLGFLSAGADSVCVVGDDDQNIFQWRGSNIQHILGFPKKYGATTEKLDVNYRATQALVGVSSRLIGKNSTRVPKGMKASDAQPNFFESGDIAHRHFDTDTEEFRFIGGAIGDLLHTSFADKHGHVRQLSYRDMVIIVKTNEDAARITEFLSGRGVPCVADSGTSVFKRPLVELAVDCILHVFDHDGYATPGVPDLEDLTRRYSESVPRGDAHSFAEGLESVRRRADMIKSRGGKDWLPVLGLQGFYHRILSAMGAERGVFSDPDLYNLAVVSKAIADYEYVYRSLRAVEVAGLKWFITMSAESSYADPSHEDPGSVDAVRILTIWKAKGLEFPVVFVPSFEKRRKPVPRAVFVDKHLYDSGRYGGGDEDDRRAYYTAITRSQKYLFVTGASQHEISVTNRPPKSIRQPHPFLDEMYGREFSMAGPIKRPKVPDSAAAPLEGTIPSSFSELSIYDRCPHDYLLRHVMGFNAGVPSAFGYGTNIHNILNAIHSDYIRNGTIPTRDETAKVFDDMFYMRFAPGKQSDNMKRSGMSLVEKYIDLHSSDFDRILETEKRFEFVIEGALVSGSIDLLKSMDKNGVINGIEVIDFKTDRDDTEYQLDHAKQVRFYAHAIRASLGQVPERATIHYLDRRERDGTDSGADKLDVDIGADKLEETKAEITKTIGMITSRRFDPVPEDSKCRGCDFKAICAHKGFEVGSDHGPMPRGDPDRVQPGGTIALEPLGPSEISAGVRERAQALATGGSVAPNPDGTYKVSSTSTPSTTYRVSGGRCQCRGFRDYSRYHPGTVPTCSHVEAVKIFQTKHGAE